MRGWMLAIMAGMVFNMLGLGREMLHDAQDGFD